LRIIDQQRYLAMRAGAEVLESDRHGEKVLRLADGSFLKLFRRKRLLSSAAWSPYAQRFADNAVVLDRLGIRVPQVIDVMRVTSMRRDVVHYVPLEGSSLRTLARGGLDPATEIRLKAAFNDFVVLLHEKGIYFRSLHLGNVILMPDGQMGLIDFADLRIYRKPLARWMRIRNIRRLQRIAGEIDWLDSERLCEREPG
jgi:tRNA A-37 threonylcarbamoyl transferase component Bud32